jgi:hypothetical protein
MLTRLVVVRGLLRLFFFDDMFEPDKEERTDSESTQTRSKFQEKKYESLYLSRSFSRLSLGQLTQRRHEEAQKKTRQPPEVFFFFFFLRQSPSKRAFDPRRVRHKKCAVFVTRGRRVRRRRRRRKKAQKPLLDGTPKKLKI